MDMCNIHWSLCKCSFRINQIFRLRLIYTLTLIFFKSIVIPYLLVVQLMRPHSSSRIEGITLTGSLFFSFSQLIYLVHSADSATNEVCVPPFLNLPFLLGVFRRICPNSVDRCWPSVFGQYSIHVYRSSCHISDIRFYFLQSPFWFLCEKLFHSISWVFS